MENSSKGEELLMLDTEDLIQLDDPPDMDQKRQDRIDRNRDVMSAINPSVANQVLPKVKHSQKPGTSSATALRPWIISKRDGEILTAHCNCMAGLGESCSHIGAVLFYVRAGTTMRDSVSCTQEECKWMMPASVKQVPYLQVKEMDLTSAKRKRKRFEDEENTSLTSPAMQRRNKVQAQASSIKPSPDEIQEFYNTVSLCGTKPAILSLIPEHSDRYVQKQSLPKPLTDLFEEKNLQLTMEQLQDVSKTTVLPQITPDIVRCVQEGTRQQANSKLWFRLRAGRITASRLHAVCHTNPSSPSRSLVLAVCYPESSKFETPATSWGIQKEKTARCEYLEILKRSHQGVSVVDTGLHLNQEWPFLGATPDGQVTCSCCGAGICEIKCPYTVRDQHLQHVAKTNFCLVKDENGILFLSKTHQYYYQTDNLPQEHKAAVCIQRHVRGHLDRKRYIQLLLEQFEEEEKMRLEKTMKQVEEGQLLVENHQLEVQLDDNQTTRRNKKRHYLSNVITLQRAWRAYKRSQSGRDAGNNNMSPHSPESEPDLSESDSTHGPQGMSLSTPDDTTPSLSTENEVQSDFESTDTPELGSPLHREQNGESESVVSDVSELAGPLKDLAEEEVDIVQNANLRKSLGPSPLTETSHSNVTSSYGIIERKPRETDEEFSKRVRKLNFLSLAQEFAELKKIDANALPFDLHKGHRFLSASQSPEDTVDGEPGTMEKGELVKGGNPPTSTSTLPKNFKVIQGMSRLSTSTENSLPKNYQQQHLSSSFSSSPPKNATSAVIKEERKYPANMGRNSPAKERNSRKTPIGSSERLEDFDVYNIETTLPQMDWETLEQQLQLAAAEEEKKKEARRNDREEIRRKLAMGTGDEEYYYGERTFKKPSLQTRLQSGMNLQICFMNEASTLEGEGSSVVDKGQDGEQIKKSSPTQQDMTGSEKKPSPGLVDRKPGSHSPLKNKSGGLTVTIDEPVEDEDFFKKQARLQAEARLALAQASTMAHMQLEVEKQMKKKSPIADMVGIPGFGDGRRHKLTRKMLEGMNLAQIQVLVNDLHSQIENLNEDLVRMLVERDDLHMEQDSMLVDIEDLTRRAQEFASLMDIQQTKVVRRK